MQRSGKACAVPERSVRCENCEPFNMGPSMLLVRYLAPCQPLHMYPPLILGCCLCPLRRQVDLTETAQREFRRTLEAGGAGAAPLQLRSAVRGEGLAPHIGPVSGLDASPFEVGACTPVDGTERCCSCSARAMLCASRLCKGPCCGLARLTDASYCVHPVS